MASSSAGAMGVGSATSLITVQNSGSDGRKGVVAAPLRSGWFGTAAVVGGADGPPGAVTRGCSRTFGMRDLATAVLRGPLACALADPRGMVEQGIDGAGLDLELW